MTFLDESYLLDSEPAREIYASIKDFPILDAHNHADMVEIVEDKPWPDIWVVEGATDHYVWELMRRRGIDEEEITGEASNEEKWYALAGVTPELAGNPFYEWIHLDLRRRFGITEIVSKQTAGNIWDRTYEALQTPGMRPQNVLGEMNVEVMCTTDNPSLILPYHDQMSSDLPETSILPTWRPDIYMNIEKQSWKVKVESLGEETDDDTSTLQGLLEALKKTHRYFDNHGCVASDHGIREPYGFYVPESQAATIHERAFSHKELTDDNVRKYKAYLLNQFGEMNAETGWVMQLHIGPVRDYRDTLYETLGPDSGGDISSQQTNFTGNLSYFLNQFDQRLDVVLYCIDPSHLPTITTIARAFPNIYLGAPWWFNDSPYGMETFLRYVSSVDLLSNLAGMVTDSRKLVSFESRTEMFRRVLSNVVGDMVRKGQMPMEPAYDIVELVAYTNPKDLFFSELIISSG